MKIYWLNLQRSLLSWVVFILRWILQKFLPIIFKKWLQGKTNWWVLHVPTVNCFSMKKKKEISNWVRLNVFVENLIESFWFQFEWHLWFRVIFSVFVCLFDYTRPSLIRLSLKHVLIHDILTETRSKFIEPRFYIKMGYKRFVIKVTACLSGYSENNK